MPVLPSSQPVLAARKNRWVGLLTFAVPTGVLFVLGWQTWQRIPIGVWHDDGAYLLIAESLANGGGLSWFGVSGTPPAAKFPPLFPGLLSLILRRGVEPESGASVFALANIGLLAISGGLFALFLRRALALSAIGAGVAAVVLWLSPRLWATAAIPLSEPLFLVALTAGLLASTRVEAAIGRSVLEEGELPAAPPSEEAGEEKSTVASLLTGLDFLVAFAAAFYTRTVGIVLGAAMVATCLVRGAYRQAFLLALGSSAIALPWMYWSSAATERIPEPLRDVLGGYGGWLLGELVRDPVAFVTTALSSGWYAWSSLTVMLVPGLPGQPLLRTMVSLVLAAIAARGLYKLSRHSLTAVFVVLIYLVTVAVWPFRSPRLLVPILPLVGLACGLAFRVRAQPPEIVGLPRTRPDGTDLWVRRGLATIGLLIATNYGVRSVTDLIAGDHLVPYQVRAEALQAAVQSIDEFTVPGSIVGAPELWSGLQIHGNRVVAPSARFLPLATDGPSWGTPKQQYQLWLAASLDYIVVEHAGGVHGEALDRLDAECPGGAVELVAVLPSGFLVRLGWDEECQERVLR
jgi:hypothetical protein